jgi:hypothetical protein
LTSRRIASTGWTTPKPVNGLAPSLLPLAVPSRRASSCRAVSPRWTDQTTAATPATWAAAQWVDTVVTTHHAPLSPLETEPVPGAARSMPELRSTPSVGVDTPTETTPSPPAGQTSAIASSPGEALSLA